MRHLTLITLLLLAATLVPAQMWRVADAQAHPGPFLSGMVSGILLHEAGHVTVALSKGYTVSTHGFSLIYPNAAMSEADHLHVASAGLQSQWLYSEWILRAHEAHPETPLPTFQAGMVAGHLAITAAYITVLKDHPYGDLLGISQSTGLTTSELALLITVPAALDAWRLTGKSVPRWVPALSAATKGTGIAAVWTF
jgi:hypothetical protein